MATVVTRAVKGINLTPTEADTNLTNINTELMAATTNVASQGTAISANATAISANTTAIASKQNLPSNPSLPSTSGNILLTFDNPKVYQSAVVTGNISLSRALSGNIPGIEIEIILDFDGVSSFAFPANWVNANGQTIDNTKRNRIILRYSSLEVSYSIIKSAIPIVDVIAPVIQTALTSFDGSTVTLTYNEILLGTPNYTLSGKTITSQIIAGLSVIITPNTPYVTGNTITVSGGNTVTDETGNAVITLSAYSVTNRADTVAPVVSSITAENATPSLITITLSKPLNSLSVDVISAFTLTGGKIISAVSVNSNKILINTNVPFVSGDTGTLAYNFNTTRFKDLAGNNLANFASTAIINNVTPVAFTQTKSITVGTVNQVMRSAFNPTAVGFSNGTTDSDFTVAFDVKVPGSSGAYRILIGVCDSTSDIYNIRIDPTSNSDKITVTINDSTTGGYLGLSTSTTIGLAAWKRVVVNFVASTKTISISVNGSVVATTNASSGTYNQMKVINSSHRLGIGGRFQTGSEYVAAGILLDNVLIISKALTTSEITEDYNGGVAKNPTTLSFSALIKASYLFENNGLDFTNQHIDLTSIDSPTYNTDVK